MYRFVFWSQLRIGIAVTVAVTLVGSLIFFIDDVQDALEERYLLHFHTSTTQPIRVRTPVWFAGQPIGHVTRIVFEPPSAERDERLHVDLSVSVSARPFITEGTAVQVITAGLLGEVVINLVPSESPGGSLTPGTEVPTARELDPSELTARFRSLTDSLPPLLERWEALAHTIEEGDGTLQRMIRRPTELAQLHSHLAQISALFDTLGTAAGDLAEVLDDAELRASLDRISHRVQTLAREWEGGTLRRAAADSALRGRLDRIGRNAARLTEHVATGRGTVGRVLHDRILTEELARTRQMVADLRADLQALTQGEEPPP